MVCNSRGMDGMLVYSSQSVTRRGEMAPILPRFIEDVQENYRIPSGPRMQITIPLEEKEDEKMYLNCEYSTAR